MFDEWIAHVISYWSIQWYTLVTLSSLFISSASSADIVFVVLCYISYSWCTHVLLIDLMCFILESLDDMTKYVCDLFSKVKNNSVVAPKWNDHPYGPTELRRRVYVVPVKDLRRLSLLWPSPDLQPHWEYKVRLRSYWVYCDLQPFPISGDIYRVKWLISHPGMMSVHDFLTWDQIYIMYTYIIYNSSEHSFSLVCASKLFLFQYLDIFFTTWVITVIQLKSYCLWFQPEHYIGHLLGHEGPGSLLSALKGKGWCNTLCAGGKSGASGFSFITMDLDVTVEGLGE